MKLSKKFNGWKRLVALGLAVALLGIVAAANEGDLGICGQAYSNCMGDAIIAAVLTGGATIGAFLHMCFVGYTFCHRYVEAVLNIR